MFIVKACLALRCILINIKKSSGHHRHLAKDCSRKRPHSERGHHTTRAVLQYFLPQTPESSEGNYFGLLCALAFVLSLALGDLLAGCGGSFQLKVLSKLLSGCALATLKMCQL